MKINPSNTLIKHQITLTLRGINTAYLFMLCSPNSGVLQIDVNLADGTNTCVSTHTVANTITKQFKPKQDETGKNLPVLFLWSLCESESVFPLK